MMQSKECVKPGEINIDKPRYDQETYIGRMKHFFSTTNPLNILASNATLEKCADIVKRYKNNEPLKECISVEELWKAKILYDSAYHPETGQKMNIIGRMSAQVPMNTIITCGMMVFYKGMVNTIFWQWLNQSFNAVVNYTNRSGNTDTSVQHLFVSYICATTGAVSTALTLNHYSKWAPPLAARFIPFTACAIANVINISIMRSPELQNGILLVDDKNKPFGYSSIAARNAIIAVIFSRIFMSIPSMMLTPLYINYLERKGILAKYPWINVPAQAGLIAFCLTFATPMCCALFKQKAEIEVRKLEPDLQTKINSQFGAPTILYYNKGL